MEKFLVSVEPSKEEVKPSRRLSWKRSKVELNGRFEPNYRHEMMNLLSHSYAEIRAFPHMQVYPLDLSGPSCRTHASLILHEFAVRFGGRVDPCSGVGVTAVDFDKKGKYVVSVTKSGCLTVHNFEALYCKAHELNSLKEAESILHLSLLRKPDVVRWNPLEQDEVICASEERNDLLILNVGYFSSQPVEVLRRSNEALYHGYTADGGLTDVAIMSNGSSWILASDTHGWVNVWDRRVNSLPCLQFMSATRDILNSIQVDAGNQLIFGAGELGFVYVWDIRGGTASATSQSHQEVISILGCCYCQHGMKKTHLKIRSLRIISAFALTSQSKIKP